MEMLILELNSRVEHKPEDEVTMDEATGWDLGQRVGTDWKKKLGAAQTVTDGVPVPTR